MWRIITVDLMMVVEQHHRRPEHRRMTAPRNMSVWWKRATNILPCYHGDEILNGITIVTIGRQETTERSEQPEEV